MKAKMDNEPSFEHAIKELNCKLADKVEFELPIEKSKRTILKFLKESRTNNKYPRKFSEINDNLFKEIYNKIMLKEQKELNFLQRKRGLEFYELKKNNYIIIPKENDFSILSKNKIIKNISQHSNSGNIRNDHQTYPNNYKINIFKKVFAESLDNPNLEEKKQIKFYTYKENIKENENYNNSISIKKEILDSKTNNEIKVLKNNKIVFINSNLLNTYSTTRAIKKLNEINYIIRNKRSSKFRGVSKNGNNWQVLMMVNNEKHYIGSYQSEELAARIYDILSIKKRGIKARTNFFYNNIQLKKIFEKQINIKSPNISDIISNLIKNE